MPEQTFEDDVRDLVAVTRRYLNGEVTSHELEEMLDTVQCYYDETGEN